MDNCKYRYGLDFFADRDFNKAMRIGGISLLLLLAGGIAMADTVTGVSCATFGAALATSSSSCYAAGTSGFSKASSTGGVTLPNGAFDPLVATAQTTVSGLQGGVLGYSVVSTATANADVQVNLETGGSMRQGLLEVTFAQTAWQLPYFGVMTEQLSIGSYSYSCPYPCLLSSGLSLPTFWIPIELGTGFGFDLSQSVSSQASAYSGLTGASIGSQVSVLAFEADGTTAVQLFDPPGAPLQADGPVAAPEPNTSGLLALIAIFGAGAWWARRRIPANISR